MMHFAHPWFLLLILVLPLLRRRKAAAAPWPSLLSFASLDGSSFWGRIPALLHWATLVLLIIALARPQWTLSESKRTTEGIDIYLVLDTSGSMRAQDFKLGNERPTRLAAIKAVVREFIPKRLEDRIGLVVFGTEAFTQAPLTLDHGLLDRLVDDIEIGMAGDATAIGDGLATAVKRLRDSDAKSKIVVLLTDGTNTAGRIDPLGAAAAAKAFKVKVYTIGAGSKGKAPMVIGGRVREVKVDIDEELLTQIAKETGGQYFRAYDTDALREIYGTIDRLEKTKVESQVFQEYEELFGYFVAAGLTLIAAQWLFGLSRWQRIPC